MKKFYIILLSFFLFQSFLTAQTFTKQWVNFNQDSTADFFSFNDMAVDKNGNTYLAGYETDPGDAYYETHFYLLKVNAAGNAEWKRNFNEQKDSIDEAIAIAVDDAGYVYVTGRRIDTFCNICTYNTKISDIITMKYDAWGNRMWLNRYHDSAYLLAEPSDIALSNNGTILITGNERHYKNQTGSYVSKLLMQKIDVNGETKWVKKMGKVVGNSGRFDNNNNIIIAGASDKDNLYQTQKPVILKFNTQGSLIWSDIYNEPNKNGGYYFVECDAANNIYINGQTDTLAFYNNPKIITVKYNAAGNRLWFKKEADHTTSILRYQGDFKIDAEGNSYVTGFLDKSSVDDDWITSKYDSAGKKKWTVSFNDSLNGSDRPKGLAVDEKGNVFVTGHVVNGRGDYAIGTIAYNKKGEVIGEDVYGKRRGNAFPVGIGIDKNNNVYVGGSIGFYDNPYPASIVIKYKLKQPFTVAENSLSKITNDLKLFPNPVISQLNIQLVTSSSSNKYNCIITDVSGNIVFTKQAIKSEKILNLNIDVQQLKQGIYTATISNGINTVSKTFIKQ